MCWTDGAVNHVDRDRINYEDLGRETAGQSGGGLQFLGVGETNAGSDGNLTQITQGGETGTITVTEYGQKKDDPATLVGYNAQQDVALLKIIDPGPNLPTVTFGSSSKAGVGDAVVAICTGLSSGRIRMFGPTSMPLASGSR